MMQYTNWINSTPSQQQLLSCIAQWLEHWVCSPGVASSSLTFGILTVNFSTGSRRRYVNFEDRSHFICSFNLNNPELTVCVVFRMNDIASGTYPCRNSLIGNNNGTTARFITFYETNSGLGLMISNSYSSYVTVANDNACLIWTDHKLPSLKANCTFLNKWHVISVTWSNRNSNCWSEGVKIMIFASGNAKGTDHCIIGNIGKSTGASHLIGCIGEIVSFYGSLSDTETSYIHKYLIKKWGID